MSEGNINSWNIKEAFDKHQQLVEKTTIVMENKLLKTENKEIKKIAEDCIGREEKAKQEAEEQKIAKIEAKQETEEHRIAREKAEEKVKEEIIAREKAEKEAEIDIPTGFLNNLGLTRYQERLKETPEKFPAVFCAIDLDNLGKINNAHGHKAGNEYIFSFARFVKKKYPTAIAFRLTRGDEFGLIMEYPESVENSNFNEKGMYSLLEEFNNEEKNEIKVSLACGFSPINSFEDFDDAKDKADEEERRNKIYKKSYTNNNNQET